MTQRFIRDVHTPAAPQALSRGMSHRTLIAPGNWADYDPFLVLAEDWMHEPGGFPDHPHRGIETVTLVLDVSCIHLDVRGNAGVLLADDAQWMTAGKGIIRELPNAGASIATLQLWLNLPAAQKMVESAYQDLLGERALRVEGGGASIRLLSGSVEGLEAPAHTRTPIPRRTDRARSPRRATDPGLAQHGFVLVVEGGRASVRPVAASAGQVLWLDYPQVAGAAGDRRVDTLRVAAEQSARVLVVTGEPIRERVVAYGPFVMNTEDESRRYRGFHSGKFGGPTPAAAGLAG